MASPQPSSSSSRRGPGGGDVYISKYKRQESIGKGSFATVYKAVHPDDGSLVAIKTVQHAQLKGKLKANLFSEIKILRNITHPHIVALIDILESTNHIHLVMEFCQLGDLATFVRKRDKLVSHPVTADMLRAYPNPPGAGFNEVIVRHFAKQLASALEFLRSRNLVHRDLKPQNLLLNPPPSWISKERPENRPFAITKDSLVPATGLESLPVLKIADFGFARHLPTTTMAETLCGSPLYMAPEILRYEKYDAKADLWSVGTVLYELMVGKPPFRASNHVDLLRKIEQTEDKIRFPESLVISSEMKKVIRALLKRMPTERPSWEGFFKSEVVVDEIPGLVSTDKSKRQSSVEDDSASQKQNKNQEPDAPSLPAGEPKPSQQKPSPRSSFDRKTSEGPANPSPLTRQESPRQPRPSLVSHVTAPAAQVVQNDRASGAPMAERRNSQTGQTSGSTASKDGWERDRALQRNQDRLSRDARERAAQDVAFERDYVIVDQRAVEINAFADEMAANQNVHRQGRDEASPQAAPMVRRATTQATPAANSTAQQPQSRAMQAALSPQTAHQRRPSYERRYGPNRTSATSALAAALNMVNHRLSTSPFAPFLPKGPSPPQGYGPYPAFPATQPSPLLLADYGKPAKLDEEHRIVSVVEDSATRSDVVYGFAEVKYKQLVPMNPSNDNKFGGGKPDKQVSNDGDEDDELTADAIVGISEEALVLYVKSLAILTNTINLAGSWWAHRNRGEGGVETSSSPKSLDSGKANLAIAGPRVNNVVQWARNRFNECLEKSEYVSRKLVEAQRRLPEHHPGHPNNRLKHDEASHQELTLTSGITAEKLMYDRAVEMSKSAAMNELLGEDLSGCEVSYLTAMRLLEAVVEKDGEPLSRRGSSIKRKEKEQEDEVENAEEADQIDEGDRKTVLKLIEHVRQRLHVLRKKMAMASANKRNLQGRSPPPEPATGAPSSAPAAAASGPSPKP